MKALRCRGDLPATSSGGQPPPAPFTPLPGAPLRPPSPNPDFVSEDDPRPGPQLPQPPAEAGTGRVAARGSEPPLPSWGPSAKPAPPGRPPIAPSPAGPALRRPGAREGAAGAGAGPGYLQEESFGFGSPLLGPVQLTLPLPAAEKRKRLRRAPSRAPAPRCPPGCPAPRAAPRPRQPPKLTSARRRR